MKKLAFSVIVLLQSFYVNAQSTAKIDTSLLIEDIVIQQNRISTPMSESARFIDIVTKEEIDKLPVTNIPELLQYTGAVDIRRRGINGVQSDAGIRGSTFNQILILINGVRMSDPQTGHHMMNLPLALEDIERIEIIKGPAARIFGMNAMAGAINIITKNEPTNEFKMKAGVTLSDFTTLGVNISAHLPGKTLNQSLSLTRQGSEGYRYNTDYNINTAFYQANLNFIQTPIKLQAGFTEREFGANGFYANESFTEQYEEVRTGFISASTTINKGNLLFKPRLSWRTNKDEYVFLRNNPSFFMNQHRSNTYIGELHSTYLSSIGETGIGIDVNRETLSSNNLGERQRTILGVFLEQRMHFVNNKLSTTFGFYGNKVTEKDFKIYPGIDISFSLTPKINLFTSANWSDRIPTYTNLYYTSSSEQGNENLVAESSTSFELGGKYNTSKISLTLSVFKRKNSNLIDWAKDSTSQQKWLALNFNEVNVQGSDISLKYKLVESRGININIDYTYIDSEVVDEETIAVSRYALDNLSQQLIAGLDIDIISNNLTLHTNYRYLDRVSLEDYQLIDMKLSYKGSNFNAFINANNLLDTKYRETNLVPMPGRWFGIGFQFY